MDSSPLVSVCCPGSVGVAMDRGDAARLATRFRALSDAARVQLLNLVANADGADGAEACVCDLTAAVGLSQGTVSHHLKILVDAGLLQRDRRGTWAWFRLAPGGLEAMADSLRTTSAV